MMEYHAIHNTTNIKRFSQKFHLYIFFMTANQGIASIFNLFLLVWCDIFMIEIWSNNM